MLSISKILTSKFELRFQLVFRLLFEHKLKNVFELENGAKTWFQNLYEPTEGFIYTEIKSGVSKYMTLFIFIHIEELCNVKIIILGPYSYKLRTLRFFTVLTHPDHLARIHLKLFKNLCKKSCCHCNWAFMGRRLFLCGKDYVKRCIIRVCSCVQFSVHSQYL
uniref:Uncharacterized protein n=1 Tax=Cacopsylla melanoneura TaxID=428564 RepID=A0A8D8YDH1_9HEMI